MSTPSHLVDEGIAPKGWEVCAALAIAVVGTIIGCIIYLWLAPPLERNSTHVNTAALMAIQSAALALAITPMFISRGTTAARAIGFIRVSPHSVAVWSIVLLAVSFALDHTILPVSRLWGARPETLTVAVAIEVSLAKNGLALTLLMIAILAPLGEEIFFRGVLFGWLRTRLRLQWAVLLQAILFGIVHLQIVHILIATVLGIGLGIARERSRSLWPPIGAHCLVNAVSVMEIYLRLDGSASG